MTEATLFALLVTTSLVAFVVADAMQGVVDEKCKMSIPTAATDSVGIIAQAATSNIFVLTLTNPCVMENAWFVWAFLIPVAIVGILIIASALKQLIPVIG